MLNPIRDLPSLKKLAALRDITDTPIETRFSEALVKEWRPLIVSLSKGYQFVGRLESQDIYQELLTHLWKLTRRVDPVSKPDDFRRMARAELRNKCIDLNRWIKARKRLGRIGKAVQCQCCGAVSRISIGDPVECFYCKESNEIREVDLYAKNLSIVTNDEDEHTAAAHNLQARSDGQPSDSLIFNELAERIGKSIPGWPDRHVLEMMLNPPEDFISHLESLGFSGDHRSAPSRHYASYLNNHRMSAKDSIIVDRDVSDAQTRIKVAILHICNISTGDINKVTMKRLGLG